MRLHILAPLTCLAGIAIGTAPAHLNPQQIFRSGVHYVRVDAVVTDRSDRPIADLRKDEFEITENGKPQTVADFQFVSVPATLAVAAQTANEPEPDVATNAAPSPASRLFVMVVDDLHLIEQHIVEIKRVLTDTVNLFSPDDEVAMVFVSNSNMSVNFTRNRGRLLAAVEHVRGALGFGLDSLANSIDGYATAQATDRLYTSTAPSRFRMQYAETAARTLQNVARSLAGSGHPRRAIFFFSSGTTVEPFAGPDQATASRLDDPRRVFDEYKKVFEGAQRADVPIYAIDPRGNVSPDDAVRGMPILSERIRAQVRRNITIQHDNLSTIAVNTGGRAVFGASDMTRMMTEVMQENGSYYLLGYYPEPFVADGGYHEIKVHVSRAGTRVRARPGYVAPGKDRSAGTTAPVLETAMASGVNVSGLPIRVSAVPLAAAAKGVRTAVTIEVSYPAPLDQSRRIDDTLEVSLLGLDGDAKVKARAGRAMRFAGTAPPSGDVTFLIDDEIQLPAQPLVLRVGVASQALGKAGTIQVPIEAPDVGDGRLQMGGVAVGSGGPHPPVMNAAAFSDLLPFQPVTARLFGSGDTLRLFARVFWKGKSDPSAAVSLSGGAAPIVTAVALTPRAAENGRREAAIDTTVPLANLAPGRYRLAIGARLPNGQKAERLVSFEIR